MSYRHDLHRIYKSLQKQTTIHCLSHTFSQKTFEQLKFTIPASERLSDHYLDSETKYSLQISEAAIDCNRDMNHVQHFSAY